MTPLEALKVAKEGMDYSPLGREAAAMLPKIAAFVEAAMEYCACCNKLTNWHDAPRDRQLLIERRESALDSYRALMEGECSDAPKPL